MNERIEVSLFGDRRPAIVTKNLANYKVEWIGMPIDSFVPVASAVNARDAAQRAARRLEQYAWGNRVLMASLRGFVESDGTISTEFSKWINAKHDGRDYDRNEKVPAGLSVITALFRLQGGAA